MKIAISSSSNGAIDEKYKESARNLLEYLTSLNDVELCWGSGKDSIMGLCYEYFNKAEKKIHGYTTMKYSDQIADLSKAEHTIYESTFELKENIFNDADIIICLAGGTGTISEFFAYLEEIRSNDINKTLIVYDEDNHFKSTWDLIDDLIKRNFNSNTIYDYFKIVTSIDELKIIIKDSK